MSEELDFLSEAEAAELQKHLAAAAAGGLNEATKYKWDKEFQREIVGVVLHEKQFLVECLPLIKPHYFPDLAHHTAIKVAFEHFDKYRTLPTRAQLLQEVKQEIKAHPDQTKTYVLGELDTILLYYTEGLQSRDYYRDKITFFAKTMALKVAFNNCLEALKDDPEADETWSKIAETLREAMTVEHNFDEGLSYFEDYEERYQRMQEALEKGEMFTSGFEAIDKALLGGGIARGEMASWVGLSGAGKSLMLVTAALANLKKGKRVMYITLEIDQDRTAERFDAQLANPLGDNGVKISNLSDKKDIVFNALHDFVDEADDKRLMVIKQFPGGSMDMATFRAYHSQMRMRGFVPDLIIIDYVGEMKDYPGIPTHESRYRITRDLRGFAVEEKVAVFTAMQPNRSAKEVIKLGNLIDDEQLGDSYAQIKPLDCMWSINQFQEERECGLARIFVVKHRFGKTRFVFHVLYDYDTLSIKQISQDSYEKILKEYRLKKEKTVDDVARDEIEMYKKKKSAEGASRTQPAAFSFNDAGYDHDEPGADAALAAGAKLLESCEP